MNKSSNQKDRAGGQKGCAGHCAGPDRKAVRQGCRDEAG